MIAIKLKHIFTPALIMSLIGIATADGFAKTYQWKDFTRPFNRELTVGIAEVEVTLPKIFIQKYREVILVVRQSGLRGDYAGIIRAGSLRVNDQSIWSAYNFGQGERPDKTIRLHLKTKHLRSGPNTLRFSIFSSGNSTGSFNYKIHLLRFELPDGGSVLALKDKPPFSQKARKKTYHQPATLSPKDTTPPDILILTHDTSRAISVSGKNKKVRIKGKATDASGIAEILVNHKDAVFDKYGNFEVDVYLRLGKNDIIVSAMDPAENRAVKKFTIVRKTSTAPPQKAAAAAPAGRFYALVIGNNAYKYLRDLETAKKDAQIVEHILKRHYGFTTKLLVDARRNEILDAINRYRKILRENDNLLIYYAGHGVFDKSADKAYWLPVDAQSDNDTNWIIVDTITSNIKRMSSKHILIVSDSCYSGTFTRRSLTDLDSAHKRDRYLQKMRTQKSRTLLASGGNEPVSDIGGKGHSVFARAFISGLKFMNPKVFTAEELYYQRVKEMVAGSSDQTPEYNIIRNSGHEGGDFLFIRTE